MNKNIMSANKLLVSVVSGSEASAALEGGADIIDIKNPTEGALGAPAPVMIREVCAELKGKKPFSIALGEFPGKPGAAALAALGSAYFNPDFVKIAFVPQSSPEEIVKTLKGIKNSLNLAQKEKKTAVVAVIFADTLNTASWKLDDFLAIAREGGAEGCLIDTWEKKGKSLLDFLSLEEIRAFIEDCRQNELFCGLAGSLKAAEVLTLSKLCPDIIGVRSAVCGGDRLRGALSRESVQELKRLLDRAGC